MLRNGERRNNPGVFMLQDMAGRHVSAHPGRLDMESVAGFRCRCRPRSVRYLFNQCDTPRQRCGTGSRECVKDEACDHPLQKFASEAMADLSPWIGSTLPRLSASCDGGGGKLLRAGHGTLALDQPGDASGHDGIYLGNYVHRRRCLHCGHFAVHIYCWRTPHRCLRGSSLAPPLSAASCHLIAKHVHNQLLADGRKRWGKRRQLHDRSGR
jgi:hypothetical protein